jgi:hypothetical protein
MAVFNCEHRIGEAGEKTQRVCVGTQSQERPMSSLVGRIRITGFGRTDGPGDVLVHGGQAIRRTKNGRRLLFDILLLNNFNGCLSFDRDTR